MRRVLLITLLLFGTYSAVALAQEAEGTSDTTVVRISKFFFDDSAGRNIVTFKSEAPLETVLGVGSALYGYIQLNLDSLSDNPQAYFEFDLRSVNTGIVSRDSQIVSETYLMTDSFPDASFKLLKFKKTDVEVLNNEGVAEVSARGEFSLHGVLDTVNCAVKLTYFESNDITAKRLPGDILKVKAGFNIRMSNYGIVIPEDDILMVDDRIHIEIDAFGGTGVQPIDRALAAREVAVEQPADTSGH